MRYRLEKLNQVQYADDENRRAELEAKGFQVARAEEDSGQGAEKVDGAGSGGDPAAVGAEKKKKAPKAGAKKPAVEKRPEEAED